MAANCCCSSSYAFFFFLLVVGVNPVTSLPTWHPARYGWDISTLCHPGLSVSQSVRLLSHEDPTCVSQLSTFRTKDKTVKELFYPPFLHHLEKRHSEVEISVSSFVASTNHISI